MRANTIFTGLYGLNGTFLLDVESAVFFYCMLSLKQLCKNFGICAWSFLTSGTSAAVEAVRADILGGGTFLVLSFSYPELPCVGYLNIILPQSYIQPTYTLNTRSKLVKWLENLTVSIQFMIVWYVRGGEHL